MLGILLVVIVAIVVLFLVWAIIYEAWASHEIWWGGVWLSLTVSFGAPLLHLPLLMDE